MQVRARLAYQTCGYVRHSWYTKGMYIVPDDSREQLEREADHLYEAMEIINRRFPSGRYNETRLAIRKVASHLLSNARHPSRQVREP